MKGLTQAYQTSEYFEKPLRQEWFFHIWGKRLISNALDLNDQHIDLSHSPPFFPPQ